MRRIVLLQAVRGISDLIRVTGEVNVDFAESSLTVGKDLQMPAQASLGVRAPEGGSTVTVTVMLLAS